MNPFFEQWLSEQRYYPHNNSRRINVITFNWNYVSNKNTALILRTWRIKT